jgi:hypothetical protein
VDESTKTNNYCMIADVAEWTAGSIKIIYDRTTCLVHKISPSGDLTGRRRSAPTRRRCRRQQASTASASGPDRNNPRLNAEQPAAQRRTTRGSTPNNPRVNGAGASFTFQDRRR